MNLRILALENAAHLYNASSLYASHFLNKARPYLIQFKQVIKTYSLEIERKKIQILTHKKWLMGGLAFLVVCLVVRYFRHSNKLPVVKNQAPLAEELPKPVVPPTEPQQNSPGLTATLTSSLNYANIVIKAPKIEGILPKRKFIFCIDVSGSMRGERIDAVKAAFQDMLNQAQSLVDQSNASIEIGIGLFNHQLSWLVTSELLQKGNPQKKDDILKLVKGIICDGGTEIYRGLYGSLLQFANSELNVSNVCVLLTDGQGEFRDDEIIKCQSAIRENSLSFFAIGIGKEHNRRTLESLVGNNLSKESSATPNFQASYIDASQGNKNIMDAILTVYNTAMSTFSQIRLSCSNTKWILQTNKEGEGVIKPSFLVNLGNLKEEQTFSARIELLLKECTRLTDLRSVSFTLEFKDPQGDLRSLSLSWNPNAFIDPNITNNIP